MYHFIKRKALIRQPLDGTFFNPVIHVQAGIKKINRFPLAWERLPFLFPSWTWEYLSIVKFNFAHKCVTKFNLVTRYYSGFQASAWKPSHHVDYLYPSWGLDTRAKCRYFIRTCPPILFRWIYPPLF